jgi:hypothetical protein
MYVGDLADRTLRAVASVMFWRAVVLTLMILPLITFGAEIRATPNDYLDSLTRLKPGDTLLLQPGRYERGLPIHHINGTEARPIVIGGNLGSALPLLIARPDSNTVSIVDSSYVTVRYLQLT